MQTTSGNTKRKGERERERERVPPFSRIVGSICPQFLHNSTNPKTKTPYLSLSLSLSRQSVRMTLAGQEHFFNLDKIWVQSPNTVIVDVKIKNKK